MKIMHVQKPQPNRSGCEKFLYHALGSVATVHFVLHGRLKPGRGVQDGDSASDLLVFKLTYIYMPRQKESSCGNFLRRAWGSDATGHFVVYVKPRANHFSSFF